MARLAERVRPIEEVLPSEPGPAPAVEEPRDWSWAIFVLLASIALALRLYDLGARAMHHDESLHALYSWYLYVGRGYIHDPMMHGPFLFHITALMYLLFGDSEVTARLPMALLGSIGVALPYFLRHELGRAGAVAAAMLIAFGPSFLYFARFARNDAMIVFEALLIVIGIFGWLRTRRSLYMYLASIGLAIMFTAKEVSFIYGFIFATFLGLAIVIDRRWGAGELLEALEEIGWRRWGIAAAIFFGISGVLYTTFFTNLEGLCTALWSPPIGTCAGKQGAVQYWLAQQGVARGAQPWFYYLLLIPLYETLTLLLGIGALVLARPRNLFFWFCVWWAALSLAIYSWAGEKMPWLVVHSVLPFVLLAALTVERIAGWARGPWGLTPRQWSVAGLGSLGLAAFAAWLGAGGSGVTPLDSQTALLRRIALSFVAAAIVTGIVWIGTQLTRRQLLGALASMALILVAAYTVRSGWQVTYKNGDTPVDMLVYVQSSPDVPFIVREMERVGNTLGLRKEVPILLDGGYSETVAGQNVAHEAVSWPFEWYLRDYKAKQYFSKNLPGDFSTGRYAAVLAMSTNLDPIRDQLDGYTGNKFRLNWWYPEDYKQLAPQASGSPEALWKTFFDGEAREKFFGTIWLTLTDATAREKLAKYVLYRELINPPLGAREMYFYVRNDLVGSGTGPPGASVAVLPSAPRTEALDVGNVVVYGQTGGRSVLSDPKGIALGPDRLLYVVDGASATVTVFNPDGTVARSWGRRGTGDGEFTEPWGIAVAPDGSVFVADTWNHRIQKFDPQGRFLLKWGAFTDTQGLAAASPGNFFGPRDISFTREGNLLVVDTGNERLQMFDQNGRHLRSYGGEGRAVGQFREPVGIAVDQAGRIYVADLWNQRIQVFSSQFDPIAQYAVPSWTSQAATHKAYLAVTLEGDVYATLPERQALIRVRDGVAATVTLPSGPRLSLPIGVKAAEGRLLVSDAQAGVVVAYQLAGDGDQGPVGGE